MSKFLAFVEIGGGGSWGQGSTKETALNQIANSLRDWRSLYDIEGKEVEVGLYDITAHPQVRMGSRGVFDTETDELVPMLETAKVVVPSDEMLAKKSLEQAQKYKTVEEVVAAFHSDDDFIGYETALDRLQQLGLSEKQADDALLD